MLMKEIIAAYDVLDSSFVTGEEVKKYLEWRANGGKMNTETLPDGYVEACKKILERI